MRANGYGADLELTDDALVIHAGRVASTIQASPTITIPVTDIASLDWKDASTFVNGRVRVFVKVGADLSSYGSQPNAINPQSLVVHWRRRDREAFAAIRDRLTALIAEEPPTRPSTTPIEDRGRATPEPSAEATKPEQHTPYPSRPADDEQSLRDLAKRAKSGALTLQAFELWDCKGPSVEVAGEAYHRAELAALYSPRNRRSGEEFWTEAALVPEVGNVHDANAVRVEVEGHAVGYLAREDAVRYRCALVRLVVGGYGPVVQARVWASRDDGTWRGRVTLSLGEPHSIVPVNARPTGPVAELPEGRSLQVSGEEAHFDVLSPLLVPDRRSALWCSLHAFTIKTARSEKRVAEVRVDGLPVGNLSPATSADLLSVLDRAEATGRCVVAHGFLSGNSLSIALTLSVPRAADLTEEWIGENLAPSRTGP